MSRRADALIALAITVLSAVLYLVTLAPGLPFPAGDSHELTTAAASLGIAHRTGYPLYTWLGFLFATLLPVGDVAYRVNAMSAVLGAVGVGGIYVLGRQLDLRPLAAAFSALLFGLARTYWSQAVIAEVYAVNLCVLMLLVNLLVAWSHRRSAGLLVAFALVFGLSAGTHMSNLSLAPAYGLFILLTDWRVLQRPRLVLAMLGVFLVGLAQFAWLPLRAATVRFPNPTPDTVAGFLAYTVGAFSESRFAFGLSALPERLALYLSFLSANFTPVGVAAGLVGMWVLLGRHPVRFWLVCGSFATNLVVSSQLAVFGVDVHFIAGYVPWVLFVGFAVDGVLAALRRRTTGVPVALRTATAVLVLAGGLLVVGRTGFAANDRRTDTAEPDFQRNVFAMLPPGSALIAPSGVFAQNLVYFHRILGLRPDVDLIDTPDGTPTRPAAPRFTTLTTTGGQLTGAARWSVSPTALPDDAWFVPVLAGARHDLVLWRVETAPPVFAPAGALPAVRSDHRFPEATLEGYTVTPAATGRVHLETHWQLARPDAAVVVSTRIGTQPIESHELGFGNRRRYAAQVGSPGTRVVESFDLVVPSHLPAGRQPLAIGVTRFGETGLTTEWLEVGHVDVG